MMRVKKNNSLSSNWGEERYTLANGRKGEGGFTLVEMIVVIVITGILGGIVAMFIRSPVQGYVDSARRAEMADIADTALRRITRDLRLALPNSVQVHTSGAGASTVYYLDFLFTTGGGRYRASGTGTTYCPAAAPTNGDALIFSAADTCFEILGPQVQFQANDQVVIYNMGVPGADAYSGLPTDVRRAYAGATAAPVSFVSLASTKPFPFESPSQRFQVVHEQVRYICDPVAGTLTRYAWAGNAIVAPSATVPAGAGSLLADKISACTFTYDNNSVVTQQAGLVSMWLAITENGETVSLYSAAHVSNIP